MTRDDKDTPRDPESGDRAEKGHLGSERERVEGDPVSNPIDAAEQVVTKLISAAGSITQQLIVEVGNLGTSLVGTTAQISRALIEGATDVGGEFGAAIGKAAPATIEGISKIGADLGSVATGAVKGTVGAAASIGEDATGAVRDVMKSATRDVRKVVQGVIEDWDGGGGAEPSEDWGESPLTELPKTELLVVG